MITVAALTPSLDLTYLLDGYRLGQVHRTPGPVAVAGGKALNMARAARAMGADVEVVTLLGGATGRRVADLAADEGLPLVQVAAGAETRTCVSVADSGTGELTEIYEDSPPVGPQVLAEFASVLAERLRARPGWLSISGRGPSGTTDAVAVLVEIGTRQRVPVAVDTHGEALPGAVAAGPRLVKVNRAEAAELLGSPVEGDLLQMAVEIHQRSGAAVVLTDATAGSVAVDNSGRSRIGPPTRRGDYPVGSGDSFLGGLLAALEQGADLGQAVRLGTGCAVANALVPGQGHFDAQLARALAAEVQVEPAP